ncbi:hypothetical protein STRDD13_00947 [Streptococcus sp. DD13]|nr:hypothetical protein STRDD13_00947 [Streptococcus sp. DD13]
MPDNRMDLVSSEIGERNLDSSMPFKRGQKSFARLYNHSFY